MAKTKRSSAKSTVKKTAAKGAKIAKKSVKSAMAVGQAVEEKAVKAAKKTNAFAKKNPWAVAGIAAGVGIATGLLMRGGKGKKKKK
jgi:ElaB/YqjD/DUF883 family membrane-anchored ribosome-binding protein